MRHGARTALLYLQVAEGAVVPRRGNLLSPGTHYIVARVLKVL